jgi:FdhE protein
MEKQEGKLPLLLEFYRDLLKVQTGILKKIHSAPAVINNEVIKSRLAAGQPLLTFGEIETSLTDVRQPYARVIDVFAAYPQLFGELPGVLKKSGDAILRNADVVKAWFNGTQLPEKLMKETGENNGVLVQAIVQAAMRPFLVNCVNALKKSMNHNIQSWRRAYCPYCGGRADIAYLEKEVGARWLVCSRCDTAWPFPRLQCPYCLNQDQKMLSFFMDNTGQYRLQVCEKCKCYLKTVDLRKANDEVLMPLERMLTVEMDRQAREKGYHSC